jgi:DNA-binding CsgD family transcriptional regulator/Tfp pilus assembly protein PilF
MGSQNLCAQYGSSSTEYKQSVYDTVKINTAVKRIENDLDHKPKKVLDQTKKLLNVLKVCSLTYFLSASKEIEKQKLYTFTHLKITEAKLNYFSGIAHSFLNDDVKAIKELFHALIILETTEKNCPKGLKNSLLILKSDCHNSLGIIYEYQKEYEIAMKHYQVSLKYAKQTDNKYNQAKILINLSGLYYHQLQYEKSIEILEEAQAKLGKHNTLYFKPKILNNLGANYMDLGQYEKAISYFQQALKLDLAVNNQYGCALKYGNLGYLFTQNKDFSQAQRYLNLAEHLSDSLSNLQLQLDHSRFQYEFHELVGKEKEALSYYKKHIAIRDSLVNSEKIKENAKIEANFLVEKIQIEQAAKDEIKELEIRSEKHKRFNYGIIMVLLLGLLVVISVLYKLNTDRKRLLEFENNKMREEIKRLVKPNSEFIEPVTKSGIELLNERQKEVLELLQLGKSNKEIAETLFISINTVKYHLKAIYEVLDVKHRSNLHSKN